MINRQSRMQLFEKTFIEYNNDLQNFIYSLTRQDLHAMEDIFQNTMVQAIQGLNSIKDINKMKAWLFSIAKAEARRYYNRNQSILKMEHNNYIEYENLIDIEIDLNDFTRALENKELILSILSQLSDEEQQIYILHYIYDISLKEISEILRINYNTVRSIHVRGLYKFKKICKEGEIFNE